MIRTSAKENNQIRMRGAATEATCGCQEDQVHHVLFFHHLSVERKQVRRREWQRDIPG